MKTQFAKTFAAQVNAVKPDDMAVIIDQGVLLGSTSEHGPLCRLSHG